MKHFGEQIRRWRISTFQMTLAEFAAICALPDSPGASITVKTLQKIEKSSTPAGISPKVMRKLTVALRTTPSELVRAWKGNWPSPWKIKPWSKKITDAIGKEHPPEAMAPNDFSAWLLGNSVPISHSLFPYRHLQPFIAAVEDDAMAPRYSPGDFVIAAASGLSAQLETDDEVLVELKRGDKRTIRRVRVIDRATIDLIPLNDEYRTETVARSAVHWMAPIVGVFKPTWLRRSKPWHLQLSPADLAF